MKSGLQLYSIGASVQSDMFATLDQVANMNYQGVEFAGYFSLPAPSIAARLHKDNLVSCGSHIAFTDLQTSLASTLEYEHTLNNQRIIIPYQKYNTLAEWDLAIDQIKKLSEQVAAVGDTLIYHNHGHEFMSFPGVDLLDTLYQRVPLLKFEVDVYWLAFAGIDVIDWLTLHEDRVAMLHIKDLAEINGEVQSVELGTGKLPLRKYAEFALQHQIEWLVVEQEAFSQDEPIVAAAKNAHFLNNLIKEVESS